MATVRSWVKTEYKNPANPSLQTEEFYSSSNTTLNSKGHPDLTAQNPYEKRHVKITYFNSVPSSVGTHVPCVGATSGQARYGLGWDFPKSRNVAYAKFWGKLRYGGASLGVTIAGYSQSRDMIKSKLDRAGRELRRLDRSFQNLPSWEKKAIRRLIKRRGSRASDVLGWERLRSYEAVRRFAPPGAKSSLPSRGANAHLEVTFGWLPLYEDIAKAVTTLIEYSIPPDVVKGSHKMLYDINLVEALSPWEDVRSHHLGWFRTTYAARVVISNPNLWLANRAGFVNVAGVAWDLVPWSFVYGMFSNVNQVIGSLTDDVGLTLTNQSITETARGIKTHRSVPGTNTDYRDLKSLTVTYLYKQKTRTVGQPLKPTLEHHVPELSLGLLVTAASLMVQQYVRLGKLLGMSLS